MTTDARKLAVSAHAGRVAPLFDASHRLEVFELQSDRLAPAGALALPLRPPLQRVAAIRDEGITTLICGAISGYMYNLIVSGGVQVIPWICGPVEAVVDAYATDSLAGPAWMMPGCPRGGFGSRRWRGGPAGRPRGRGRGFGRWPEGIS